MKNLKPYFRLLGLFLATSIGSNSIILCYDQAFMNHAISRYTLSFGVPPAPIAQEKKQLTFGEQMKLLFGANTFIAAERPAQEMRDFVSRLVGNHLLPANLIDKTVIDKIELVNGEGQPLENLASRLTNHYSLMATELGKKRLIEMLTQPTADTTLVLKRQALLRELVANEQLLAECKAILAAAKGKPESHLLTCLANDLKNVRPEILNLLYSPISKKRTTANHIQTLAIHTMFGLSSLVSIAGSAMGPVALRYGNTLEMKSFGLTYTILSPLFIFSGVMNLAQMRLLKRVSNYVQDHLIGAATCLNSMQKLYATLSVNEIFKNNCPALESLVTLNGYSTKHSDDFNTLIRRLETNTFKGEASFFSLTGRILSTYHLLQDEKVRSEFTPALNALGELDVLVSIALKIKEQNKLGVHYCFAEFANKNQPHINATNFWNPFVDSSKAVVNTFTFGPGNAVHNVILTGSNTGGKSTLLKALMINEILVHTFGIAAADTFVTSPFAKLTCHMNITDDTAGGKSLFQAEIDRAKDLVTMMRNLPADQFAFIIIDEIFTGTAPEQAEDLSYRFIKQLSQFKNCIFITATHFKKLIDLEKETAGACKNFHMGVIADANNQVSKYTYTITPGPSKINNALQLARENQIFF